MRTRLGRFEKLLGKVAPGWALQRLAKKMRLDHAERAYESIELSRLRKKREDGRSADQIGKVSSDRLRFQARYLDENHDIAKSVLNSLVATTVGGGIHSFPMIKRMDGTLHEEANDQMQKLWADWIKHPEVTWEYDWAKVQRLACRSWFRDGEMFAQQLMGSVPALDHGTEVMYSLELLEADFCPNGLYDDNRNVSQGVEKNTWGRPRGYWFYKNYPTEIGTSFAGQIIQPIGQFLTLNSADLKRVNASNVLHLKFIERIRQTRGISVFSSVFNRLDDLKDYEESERIAARVGAAFALAITKTIDSPLDTTGSETKWREMDVAPGIIADNLAPGEKIETIQNDRPSNNLTDFRTSQLRAVAGGTNSGFSSISKQYEGSYSSQRQELMEQNQIALALRGEFVSSFIRPAYEAFARMAIAQGLVAVAGADELTLLNAEHVGRGVPYIEPKREIEADEKKVLAGFASRSQIILERGGDPETVRKQIEMEREKDEEAGLNFSSTNSAGGAGGMDNPGAGSPAADDDVSADEEEADEEEADRMEVGHKYEIDGRVYVYTEDGLIPYAESQAS